MADEAKKYEYRGVGLSKYENKLGHEKFDEYCAIYHITQFSDLQLLEELVYREILQERFKEQIDSQKAKHDAKQKSVKEEDQTEFTIPTYTIEAMNENLEQVLSLKDNLGLLSNKEGDDGFKYLQQLEE
jgi:hypothetical protein